MAFIKWLLDVIKNALLSSKTPAMPTQVDKPINPPSTESVVKPIKDPSPEPKQVSLSEVLKAAIKPYEQVRETNGKNRSPVIDKIITGHGGALGSAYCCYGVQQVLDDVEAAYKKLGIDMHFDIPGGGSTQQLWAKANADYKVALPKASSLVVWRHMGNPSTGHIGFCLSGNNGGKFETFEFNTSADSSAVVRDGEGAYYRNRPFKDVGDMHILGFIDLQKAMKFK